MRSVMVVTGLLLVAPASASGLGPVTPEMLAAMEQNSDQLTDETTGNMLKAVGVDTAMPAPKQETGADDAADPATEMVESDAAPEPEGEIKVADATPVTPREAVSACVTCHGLNGIAKIPIAPHLAGESRVYLETQLKAFRTGKRVHEMMTVIAKDMTDADIKAAAKWYSAIAIEATIPE